MPCDNPRCEGGWVQVRDSYVERHAPEPDLPDGETTFFDNGDEYVGQWLFYTLIYGLVAVGTAYAARAIVRSEPAAVAAGTFAVLNGFFLTRLPNPLNIISVDIPRF